jgi:hypothetical protein
LERRTGIKNDDIEDFVDKVLYLWIQCIQAIIIAMVCILGIESSAGYSRLIKW